MKKDLDKVILAKQFFIKCFWISLAILFIVWVFGTLAFNLLANFNETVYGLETDDFAMVFAIGIFIWKVFIIQFALVPYLVTLCIEKYMQKQDKKHDKKQDKKTEKINKPNKTNTTKKNKKDLE